MWYNKKYNNTIMALLFLRIACGQNPVIMKKVLISPTPGIFDQTIKAFLQDDTILSTSQTAKKADRVIRPPGQRFV